MCCQGERNCRVMSGAQAPNTALTTMGRVMGSEIELKFQVSPQEMKRLSAARSLRPIGAKTTEAEKLLSVYFDTVDRRLRRKGISLRVRHNGDERVQTIKTQTSGIPFSRGQWEHKIEGDQPDLRFIRG